MLVVYKKTATASALLLLQLILNLILSECGCLLLSFSRLKGTQIRKEFDYGNLGGTGRGSNRFRC